MNKVINVNIGGVPFIINDDAFEYLESYLDALKAHFSKEEGTEEIIGDIEYRLAELFTESLGNRKIVELSDIKSAIAIIGKPEEFDDPISNTSSEDNHESDHQTGADKEPPFNFKVGKRLFKNPDDKIVSGVASGLAAYLGIKEPVLVRLGFVLLTIFGGGSGIPIYIVLMLILKEAKSPKEKLEMRGEPINLDSLTKVVKEEVNKFGETIKDFSDKSGITDTFAGSKSKKNSSSSSSFKAEEPNHKTKQEPKGTWDPNDLVEQAKEASVRFGQSFEFALRGLIKIVKPIFMMIGGIVLAALLVAWVAIIISLIKGAPAIMMFMPSYTAIANLGFLNLVFLILIPVIAIGMAIFRLFFRRKIPGVIIGALTGFWFINLASFSVVGSRMAAEFKTPFTVIENLVSNPMEVGTLHFQAIKNPKKGINLGSLSYWEDKMILSPAVIHIEKSEDENIHLLHHKTAKGKSEESARQAALELKHDINTKGDTISVLDRPYLLNPSKFRNQSVQVILRLPLDKTVSFNKNLGALNFQTTLPGDPLFNSNLRGKFLTLRQDGLKITEQHPSQIQE